MKRSGNWWWTVIAAAIFGVGAVLAGPVTGLGVAGPAGLLQADDGWVAPLLPRTDLLPHDLIDPRMPGARTGLVYPLLLEMIVRNPSSPR